MNIFKLILLIGIVWITVTLLSILTLPSNSPYMLRGSVIGSYEDNSLSYPIPSPGSYCESWKPSKAKVFWTDSHLAPPVYFISGFGWSRASSKYSGVALTAKKGAEGFNYSELEWRKIARVKEDEYNLQLFLIPESASLIFTKTYMYTDAIGVNLQTARLGIDYACNKQMLNHVPGASAFCRKDYLQLYLKDYKKRYKQLGLKNCFESLTPKSFLLRDPSQCQEFLKLAQELVEKYDETSMPVEWITKDGLLHKGHGINLLDYSLASYFNSLYRSSYANCSSVLPTHQSVIVQKYISNPALVEGRKFDFRVFVMIVNADPLIAVWAPRNGHTQISERLFSDKSKDFTTGNLENQENSVLKNYRFNLEELAEYFKDQIGDVENWLNTIAYPKIKKILVHMLRAGQQNFLVKRVGLFEFYGVDFIMDDSYSNFWLLESNRRPDVKEKNSELQYREKMIVEDFMRLAEYYLEKGFEVGDTSEIFCRFKAFEPLVDETKADPYFGVVEEECRVRFKDMNWKLPIDPMIEPLKYYIDNY